MGREIFSCRMTSLPKDVLIEAQTKSDIAFDQAINVLKKGGGTLNISEVIVGFYRVYKIKKTRINVTALLYRMSREGIVRSTKKKGEYTLTGDA